MENKRFLKKFTNQGDYDSQKDSVMGMPHVVLLEDTKEVVYASENNEDEIDYSKEFFTIEALEDGIVSILWRRGDKLYYSINNSDWIERVSSIVLEVKTNDKIRFKGNQYENIAPEIKYNVFGNIMSLLFEDDFQDKTSLDGLDYDDVFNSCFAGHNVISAKNLILPATTLTTNCYTCMFEGCTSLIEAPQLPATTLADGCYSNMFFGCTSLTAAPELPATILAEWCYSNMFFGCTSLTAAPELPATTLTSNCYYNMFQGCNKLNYIKMLATDISASDCLKNWVSGVASSGTFIKNTAMTSLPSGVSGIPNGWTVENA